MDRQVQLSTWEGQPVNFVERDGQVWFTAEEIGRNLGYANPSDDVNRLYNKNKDELEPFSVTAKLAGTDGKSYNRRIFSEEGVYLLTMLARTDKAREFRARVARLIRDIRQQRLELARQAGQKEALEAMTSMTPTQKRIADQVARYARMGLTGVEIAKLLEVSRDTAQRTLRKVKRAGLEVK